MFKKCQKCGKIWGTRDEFLDLTDLNPLGFQAHFTDGSKSILFFTHMSENCGTTISIPVFEFLDFFPAYEEMPLDLNGPECDGLCLRDNRLQACSNPNCRNALVREFVQTLKEKKKQQRPQR